MNHNSIVLLKKIYLYLYLYIYFYISIMNSLYLKFVSILRLISMKAAYDIEI